MTPQPGLHIRLLAPLLLVLALVSPVRAATVAFDPVTAVQNEGDVFTMDLVGTGFDSGDLDGGSIDFTYDPTLVEIVGVTVDPIWDPDLSGNGSDDGSGNYTGIYFTTFDSISGSMTFATVTFRAIGTGTGSLAIDESSTVFNPFATGGQRYPNLNFDQNGRIEIPAPPPDNDGDGIPDAEDPDDDNDLISDEDELANGLDPFDASDALEDLDGDGFTNLAEIMARTDIRDAGSNPRTHAAVVAVIFDVLHGRE